MMSLASLWLPILASAVLVFIASAIIWMATPLHKHDYKSPGDKEETILGFLRANALSPGVYAVPWCQGGDKAAIAEKIKSGPWAMIIVQPSGPNMGKMLGAWMFHLVVVSIIVAYIASAAGLAPGTPYLRVFQITGTAALLAHAGQAMPACIWQGQPWSQLPGRLIDALIYSLLTAGVFGWLWPKAAGVVPVVGT